MNQQNLGLFDATESPYGYKFDWCRRIVEEIEGATDARPPLEIASADVVQAMECPGLLASVRSTNARTRRRRFNGPQSGLTRKVVRGWLGDARFAETQPLQYVRAQLNDASWMTSEEAEWLGVKTDAERDELAKETAVVLSRVKRDLNFGELHTPTKSWPQPSRVTVGNLILESNEIDLIVGANEVDSAGTWSKVVLLSLTTEYPTQSLIEELGLSVVAHTIVEGCAPARIVVYGLFDGRVCFREVNAEWVQLQVGRILATYNILSHLKTGSSTDLTPGPHCERCPARDECPGNSHGLEF
jgi:hypothetical protein